LAEHAACSQAPNPAQNLDFDFEKCCSVSLSRVNVYACLVCGRYFQGRGRGSHVHTHSVDAGHALFMKVLKGSKAEGFGVKGWSRGSGLGAGGGVQPLSAGREKVA